MNQISKSIDQIKSTLEKFESNNEKHGSNKKYGLNKRFFERAYYCNGVATLGYVNDFLFHI